MIDQSVLHQISGNIWEIPKSYCPDMRVPARLYAAPSMIPDLLKEKSLDQLINVATLPGIERYALAMPDIHQGYGFPVGGIAATRARDGVISPGGIGYDINCGVRLLLSNVTRVEIDDRIPLLGRELQRAVPSGVGRGSSIKLAPRDMDDVLNRGVPWAIEHGFGCQDDLDHIEERGAYPGADASSAPPRAKERGRDQLGTIGAGNHFIEIQEVVEMFDDKTAKQWGLSLGQIAVMIHTGSRGLGHETCGHFVRLMLQKLEKDRILLIDRELAYVPFQSKEGQEYFHAMASASNFAWANRQLITCAARNVFKNVLNEDLRILYDVSHNNAKVELYGDQELIVHRKGATRAFLDQPVLIPGSMGTSSYILVGTDGAMEQSFGSTCHGAGRRLSRTAARRIVRVDELRRKLHEQGISLFAGSRKGAAEEAPIAYKDVDQVVNIVAQTGIARKIARLMPVAVIIG